MQRDDTTSERVDAGAHSATSERGGETPARHGGKRRLSIVVPCHNEADTLTECHRRLMAAARAAALPYEIVFVNDGSTDGTWEAICRLAEIDRAIVAIDLSRNHGHQLALSAGLTYCRGEIILIIDADLQDPPELLPDMLRLLDDGADVVYGRRRRRDGESWLKRTTAAAFYRVLNQLSDTPIPADTGDFRLMTRQVLDGLLRMPEQQRFIRGMVSWLGFRQVPIDYDRAARFAGATSYSFGRMARFAVDALTAFSIRPLRWASWAAGFSFLSGGILIVAGLIMLAAGHEMALAVGLPGAAIGFGSLHLLALGILGEYVGRLYRQSLGRPLFIVREIRQPEFSRIAHPDS